MLWKPPRPSQTWALLPSQRIVSLGQGGSPVLLLLLLLSPVVLVLVLVLSLMVVVELVLVVVVVVPGSVVLVLVPVPVVEVPGSTVVVPVGLSVVWAPPVVGVEVWPVLLVSPLPLPLLLALAVPTSSGLQPTASPRPIRRVGRATVRAVREGAGGEALIGIGSL